MFLSLLPLFVLGVTGLLRIFGFPDWMETKGIVPIRANEKDGRKAVAIEVAGLLVATMHLYLGRDPAKAERLAMHTATHTALNAIIVERIARMVVERIVKIIDCFDSKRSIVVFEGNYAPKSNGPEAADRRQKRENAMKGCKFSEATAFPDCVVREVCKKLLELRSQTFARFAR